MDKATIDTIVADYSPEYEACSWQEADTHPDDSRAAGLLIDCGPGSATFNFWWGPDSEVIWLRKKVAKSPWKPMSMCPKVDDGTLYLFKLPHIVVVGYWNESYDHHDGVGSKGTWMATNFSGPDRVIEPVLYMEVPECSRAEFEAAYRAQRKVK